MILYQWGNYTHAMLKCKVSHLNDGNYADR